MNEDIEALEDRLCTDLGRTENLLKCFDCFFFVSQLAMHLEGKEVDLEFIFLAFVDHGAALLYSLAGLLIVA